MEHLTQLSHDQHMDVEMQLSSAPVHAYPKSGRENAVQTQNAARPLSVVRGHVRKVGILQSLGAGSNYWRGLWHDGRLG